MMPNLKMTLSEKVAKLKKMLNFYELLIFFLNFSLKDLITSNEVILYLTVKQKEALFAKCFKWVKPGGRIYITDFCSGQDTGNDLASDRGYTMVSIW